MTQVPKDRASNRWKDLENFMTQHLAPAGVNDPQALEQYRHRVISYYLPVYQWIIKQLDEHRAAHGTSSSRPLVVGISAPQGCGKSTLCEELVAAFDHEKMQAATVSIDDFYKTHDELQQVAKAYPGNKLLSHRGNALTHDLDLGRATLSALCQATSPVSRVAIPKYDKSAFSGKGDRSPREEWRVVTGRVDVVLFEGWMLGFQPEGNEARVADLDKDLIPINEALKRYKEAWDSYVDDWLVVQVENPEFAIEWRAEAERKQREGGKPGMTEEEVAEFMRCYLSTYKLYTPALYTKGPTTFREGHMLVLKVDRNRNLVSFGE